MPRLSTRAKAGRASPNGKRDVWMDVAVIAAVFLVPAIWYVGSEWHSRMLNQRRVFEANISLCRWRIGEVYAALRAYSTAHDGRFPDSLTDLIATGLITDTKLLTCPNGPDSPAEGETTQALVLNAKEPGRVSYIYTGKGLTSRSPANAVLLYEPATNHANCGGHVLYVDGRIVYSNLAKLSIVQQRMQARASNNPAGDK